MVVLYHLSPGLYTDVVVDLLRITSGIGRLSGARVVCWKICRPVGRVKVGSAPDCLWLPVPGFGAGVLRTVALPFCLGVVACVNWSGRLPLDVCAYGV